MRSRLLIALATFICAATWVPAADAAYYVGKPVAEHYARDLLHRKYGYTNVTVACRPKSGKNESYYKAGHMLWHKWLCGFVEGDPGDSCKGALSIYGSDAGAGYYYYRHWSAGEDC